jgi:hypothetical protein
VKSIGGKIETMEPGEFSISCLSKSGYCDSNNKGPTISECMSDNSTDIFTREEIIPGINSARNIQSNSTTEK